MPLIPRSLPLLRVLSGRDGWSFGLTAVAVLLAKAGWLAGLRW